METRIIGKDITLFFVAAASFPNGVMEAHEKIRSIVGQGKKREFYGISRPDQGVIQYKAATEELYDGEAKEYHCDTVTLKKGKYVADTIHDFMSDVQRVGKTFSALLATPGIDPQGYCVEWYVNDKDMVCMVRVSE